MGEAALTIIRPYDAPVRAIPEVETAFRNFRALNDLWRDYEGQCPLTACSLCEKLEDPDDDKDDKDDGDDEESNDDDEEEDEEGKEDKNVENDDDNDEEDEEDSRGQKRSKDSASPKSRKKQQSSSRNDWRNQTERDWMTSRPYDKRIPITHRYGYTYANYTSNDHIRSWIASRGVSDDS
jgi:cobalamin biosynthesis protein CobT